MEEVFVGIGTMPQWIQVGYGVIIALATVGLYIHSKYRKDHPKKTKSEKNLEKANKYLEKAKALEGTNEEKKD